MPKSQCSEPTLLGHFVLAALTVLLVILSASAVYVIERSVQQGIRATKLAANSARSAYQLPS